MSRNRRFSVSRLLSGALLAAAFASARPSASAQTALPTGGSVAAGSARIRPSASNSLTVTQTSPQAIINWNSFSIGAGGSVIFDQPNSSASILNRVTGATPSTIAGALKANGRVYLVNPNGIAITPTGLVDVGGGFVASTLGLSDSDFLAGKNRFTGSGASAHVSNAGKIKVGSGGYAALLGGSASNDGVISVPLGKVGVGSGEAITIDPSGDGFMQVAVPTLSKAPQGKALVDVAGKIKAPGGVIELRAATVKQAIRDAVNVSGALTARSVSGRNGAIVLGGGAGGIVDVSGKLSASGRRSAGAISIGGASVTLSGMAAARARLGSGGAVKITGDSVSIKSSGVVSASGAQGGVVGVAGGSGKVDVAGGIDAKGASGKGGAISVFGEGAVNLSGARVDASGAGGGGSIELGGAKEAPDAAKTLAVDSATVLRADALTRGDGGAITLWSKDYTHFGGAILARGGAQGGNGGFAEVSSKGVLDYRGGANLSALKGKFGDLLLDPWNIAISSGADVNSSGFTASGTGSTINTTTLQNALNTANVTVSTGTGGGENGDITVASPLSWSGASTLTLNAAGGIVLNAGISNSNPSSYLTLIAGGAGGISGAGALANSGELRFNVNNASAAGALSGVISGSGSVTKNGAGALTLTGANSYSGVTTIYGGALTLNPSSPASIGAVTIAGGASGATLIVAGGATTLNGNLVVGATSADTNAAAIFSGGNLSAQKIYVGNASGAVGAITQSAGAVTTTVGDPGFLLGAAAGGTGTYNMSGGSLSVSGGNLAVGVSGTGTFTQTGGSVSAATAWGIIGRFAGSSGTYNLSGGQFTTASKLQVGQFGTGVFNISGSGIATSTGGLAIGDAGGVGTVNLNGGTLQTGSVAKSAAGGAATFNFNGGTLQAISNNLSASSFFTGLTSANILSRGAKIDSNGQSFVIGQSLAGAGGLAKSGFGTLTLSGINSYAGATTVSAGALQAGSSMAFGSSSALTLASGATADLAGNAIGVGSLAGAGTVTNSGAAATLTAGADNTSTTFSGVLQNGPGTLGLTKTGTGTLTLTGLNPFSGDTTVSAGALAIGNNDSLGAAGNTVNVATGAALSINMTSAPSYNSHVWSGGGSIVTNNTNGADVGSIIGNGAGFTGTITTTGTKAAFLDADFSNAAVVNNATLQIGISGVVKFGALSGLQGIRTGYSANAPATLIIGNLNTNSTFSGAIYDGNVNAPLNLEKVGSGTLTLAGANNYTGSTKISGGVLQFANPSALYAGDTTKWTASKIYVAPNATLAVNFGTNQFSSTHLDTLKALGTATGGFQAGSFLGVDTSSGDQTYSSPISNPNAGANTLGLTKLGANTLTLAGANSYTGATTVSVGTLKAGSATALGSASATTVASGATLDLAGYGNSVGSLAGAGTVTNSGVAATLTTGADNSSTTFSGVLQNGAGTLGLTKTGTGIFTLSGPNTYTGATNIAGGARTAGSATAFGLNSAATVASGATLDLGGYGNSVGSLAGAGTVTNSGATAAALTTGGDNTDSTFDGAIVDGPSARVNLLKTGSGALTLAGANTSAGNRGVSGGTLVLGSPLALGASGSILLNGGTLRFTAANTVDYSGRFDPGSWYRFDTNGQDVTFANALVGTALTKMGSGTLKLMGANTLSSSMDLRGGTLQIAGSGSLNAGSFAGSIGLWSGVTVQYSSSMHQTLSGAITGSSGGRVTKDTDSTSTLTLSGVNTYTGATTVSAGTLKAGSATAFGSNSAATVASGATLDLAGYSNSVGSLIGAGKVTNSGAAATLTTGGNNTSATFSGVAQDGGGTLSLTKTGAGTLTLSGANTYTGTTTVNGGVLQFAKTSALYNGVASNWTADSIVVAPGARLGVSYGGAGEFTSADLDRLKSLGTATGGFRSGASLGIDTSSGSQTYASAISDPNAGANKLMLTKTGSGTLTLSGANTYSGGTYVTGGTLKAGSATAFGSTWVFLGAGTTLDVAGVSVGVGSLTGAGTVTNSGAAAATLTTGLDNTSTVFSGVVQNGVGTLGLTKTGAGIFTLSGANTYTGATNVAGGALTAGSATAFASNSALSVASGATLDLAGYGNNVGSLAGAGTVTNSGATAATLTTGGDNSSTTFSGVAQNGTGALGLTKTGSGTLTLSGANSHTGATTISSGAISIGNTDSLGAGNTVAINSGASLNINVTSGGNVGYSHVWSGAGTINFSGSDLVTGNYITGTGNAFTGVVATSGLGKNWFAALDFSNASLVANGSALIGKGATVEFGALSGSGSISVGGLGVGGATLKVGALNTSTTFSGNLNEAAGLPLTFQKVGTGALTLSGANSYTGSTTVSAGALKAGSTTAFAPNSATTVASGATLDIAGKNTSVGSLAGAGTVTNSSVTAATLTTGGDNSSTSFSGGLQNGVGTLGLTKTGSGNFTLNGSYSNTGTTTVSAGTLTLNPASAGTLGRVEVTGGSAGAGLVVAGGSTTVPNGVVIGVTGSDTKATAQFSGGDLTAGYIYLANALGSVGSATQSGGTITANASVDPTFGVGTSGTGTYTLSGGVLNVQNGNLYVGGANRSDGTGTGAFYQTGGVVNADAIAIARYAGSSGVYDISGGQLFQTKTSYRLWVGYSGSGVFNIGNSATATLYGGLQVTGGAYDSAVNLNGGAIQSGFVNSSGGSGKSTFTFNGGTLQAISSNFTAGTFFTGLTSAVLQSGGANIDDNGLSPTIGQSLSGVGAFTKTGSGTVTLSGSNSYTGSTNVSSGTLQAGSTTAFGSNSATMVASGAFLNLAGKSVGIGPLSGAGTVTNSGAAATLTTQVDTGATTFSGIAQNGTGTLGLTKTGAGTLTLSGANTFSGALSISGGAVAIGDIDSLGAAGNSVAISSGAALNIVTSNSVSGISYSHTWSGAGDINYTTSSLGSSNYVAGSGSAFIGRITTDGAGKATFYNTDFSNAALDAKASVTIVNGGTTVQVGALTGAGSLRAGGSSGAAATLKVGKLNSDTTFSGSFGGDIGTLNLEKVGSGVLTLSGANSYTGATTVTAGVLNLSGSLSPYKSATDHTPKLLNVAVASGAKMQGSGVVTADSLTVSGAGDVSLTGANKVGSITGSGATGALAVNNAQALSLNSFNASGPISITAPGITAASGATVKSTASGTAISLASTDSFTNSAGAGALSTPNGRWLVYSTRPDIDAFGALDSNNTPVWNVAANGAVSQSGNRYVFSTQPTLTFASINDTKQYGANGTTAVASDYIVSGYQAGVSGAFLGDSAATAFSGAPSVTSAGSAATASVAGSPYSINVAQGSLSALNGYAFAYSSTGALTINQAPLTITASNQSKVYGTLASLGTSAFTASGLLNGDSVSGVTLASPGAVATAGVGSYALTPSGALGAGLSNYAISYVAAPTGLMVTPAPLIVTLASVSKDYDGKPFTGGSATFSGFANGDGPQSLSGDAIYGGSSQGAVSAGVYSIQLSGYASRNYAIEVVAGKLTIRAPQTTPITPAADLENNPARFSDPGKDTLAGGTARPRFLSSVCPAGRDGGKMVLAPFCR